MLQWAQPKCIPEKSYWNRDYTSADLLKHMLFSLDKKLSKASAFAFVKFSRALISMLRNGSMYADIWLFKSKSLFMVFALPGTWRLSKWSRFYLKWFTKNSIIWTISVTQITCPHMGAERNHSGDIDWNWVQKSQMLLNLFLRRNGFDPTWET